MLFRSHLSEAKLIDANLGPLRDVGADRVDLPANLVGAKFIRADLRDADLRYANLVGANFSEANLSGARLEHAKLTDANFIGANLQEARLGDVKDEPRNFAV